MKSFARKKKPFLVLMDHVNFNALPNTRAEASPLSESIFSPPINMLPMFVASASRKVAVVMNQEAGT